MSDLKHFNAVIGQPTAIRLLSKAITTNRIPNAFLFTGANGVGKRLTVKYFIQALFCHAQYSEPELAKRSQIEANHHPDVLWLMPTYQYQDKLLTEAEAIAHGMKRKVKAVIRTSQVRELVEFVTRAPLKAPWKVVVIEAAECMNTNAAHALLKTLEEPTATLFVLLTSCSQTLLPTIVSRCQIIPFRRLSDAEIALVLRKQGMLHILDNPTLMAMAQGSPGEAIAYYQIMQSVPQELLNQCSTPPVNLLEALDTARAIDRTLEYSQQLWLVDYLQWLWWNSLRRADLLEKLEKAKNAFLKMAQSRLVWEVVLANSV